jgi:glycosyltransferase involved in cell wall biosynthesis
MKILLISAVFTPEPVFSANLSRDLAEELSINNEVTVVCPKPTRPQGFTMENFCREESYRVIRLNSFTCPSAKLIGRFKESYSFGIHCRNYILDNIQNIDVIYMSAWPLFAQFLIISTAKKFNIKVVTQVQDIYPESLMYKFNFLSSILKFILLPIDKYVLLNSSKIIVISKNMKDYLAKTRLIANDNFVIVQNWQDEKAFVEYNELYNSKVNSKKSFTFMYMGNVGPTAGIELLIDAFASANLCNSSLVIAGSGSRKDSLMKYALQYNMGTIRFCDVPDGKVPEIQAQADVMLLPIKKGASFSSFPSKLASYMFSKKPIIGCTAEGSDIELAINLSNCGWVVPAENVESLRNAMQKVSKLPQADLCKLGLNGYVYAMNNLSKKNNLYKIVDQII